MKDKMKGEMSRRGESSSLSWGVALGKCDGNAEIYSEIRCGVLFCFECLRSFKIYRHCKPG